jgi:hypothetical protein
MEHAIPVNASKREQVHVFETIDSSEESKGLFQESWPIVWDNKTCVSQPCLNTLAMQLLAGKAKARECARIYD